MKENKCILIDDGKIKSSEELSYDEYLKKFNKTVSEKEYERRKAQYEKRLEAFEDMNDLSYKPKINQFADWTTEEVNKFLSYKTTGKKSSKKSSKIKYS